MSQQAGIAPAGGGPALSLRVAGDALSAARYWADNTLGDAWATAKMHALARLDLARGDPEAALLRYGHGIRHVKLARQSLASYKAVDRLIKRHPDALGQYAIPAVDPKRFLFFIGYSRSGHSLVGSILDAHPNVLVSHELHALNLFRQGRSFKDVTDAIQYNSGFFTRFGRGYMGYDYSVADQAQGDASALTVIGDKKANGTCAVIRRDPGIVDRLLETMPVPFSFVHVIRNPFDNIASRAKRVGTSADLATYGYFVNVDVIDRLRKAHPGLVHDVYLDDLTHDAEGVIRGLLAAIGVTDVSDAYLKACAELVFPESRRTRGGVEWPAGFEDRIKSRLAQYDFLARFADGP